MKKVLYVIIGLLAVYLILCLVGPKETVFTRSILINADPQTVKPALADFKFFTEKWSPWTEKDPQMKMTFEGEPGKPGHKYSWEGNDQVGKGSQEIISINGDSIYQKLNLITWHAEPDVYLVTKPEGNGTNVSWTIVMKNGFLGRGMSLFMSMEKMMAPDFEHGLDMLKKAVESMPAAPAATNYEVKELEWPETNFVGSKKETVAFQDIPAFFGKNFGAVMQELGKNKIEPQGAPTGIIWSYDEAKGSMDLSAVMKVAKGVKVKGYENYIFPASKVLHVAYFGDYEKTKGAHMALDAYMKEKGLSAATMMEEYANDPMVEKDTAKWLTNIYYLVK